VFEYPRYIRTPPLEGCSPDMPECRLTLVVSSPKVVLEYYTKVADTVLWIDEKKQRDDWLEMISLSHLPLLENRSIETVNKMSETKTADLFGQMLFSMQQKTKTSVVSSLKGWWAVFDDFLPKFMMEGETEILESDETGPAHNHKMASVLDLCDESDIKMDKIIED